MTLAGKLAEVTAAISNIPKTGRNTAQNYDYVTDADVSNTIRNELCKRGVATVTGVHTIETTQFVTAKGSPQNLVTVKGQISFIDAETSETLVAEGVGQGADSGD